MTYPLTAEAADLARHVPRRSLAGVEWIAGSGAFALALVSMVMFMMNTIADRVGTLIDAQNAASLRLSENLDYFRIHHAGHGDVAMPPGLFTDVVEFSRNTAIIMKEIHRLGFENFVSPGGADRSGATGARGTWSDDVLKRLKPKDGNADVVFDHTGVDPRTDGTTIAEAGAYQIELYQAIRDYSQDKCTYFKDFGGAISTYLLPLLYALLGALLYTLRSLSPRGRSAKLESLASARYAMAIIAGAVISTFNSVIPTSLSLPPLAVAFLLGYSVDIFTCWLDRLIDKIKHPAGASS